MTFKKKDILCKNNIGIIRSLEIKFHDHSHMCYSHIYIIYERSIRFLTILKLFKISGSQTKMAFKQRFKY